VRAREPRIDAQGVEDNGRSATVGNAGRSLSLIATNPVYKKILTLSNSHRAINAKAARSRVVSLHNDTTSTWKVDYLDALFGTSGLAASDKVGHREQVLYQFRHFQSTPHMLIRRLDADLKQNICRLSA